MLRTVPDVHKVLCICFCCCLLHRARESHHLERNFVCKANSLLVKEKARFAKPVTNLVILLL